MAIIGFLDFLVAATIRSIEICALLGIKNTVVHPGFMLDISKEEWFEKYGYPMGDISGWENWQGWDRRIRRGEDSI